jgi:hypothetical protein
MPTSPLAGTRGLDPWAILRRGTIMRTRVNGQRRPIRQDAVTRKSRAPAARREGFRVLFYTFTRCGNADIFADIHPLAGETAEEFRARGEALAVAIKEFQAEQVAAAILVECVPAS